MAQLGRRFLAGWPVVLCGLLVSITPATSADAYTGAHRDMALEPLPSPSQWQFDFTPYAWLIGVNGNATARGRTVDIDASFFDLVEKSDSLMALTGYFEARKGRISLFADVVWQDLSFDARRSVSGNPFPNLPNVNIAIKAKAHLGYQSTIIQSGVFYQIGKWQGRDGAYTALDLSGSARYWNEEVDVSDAACADGVAPRRVRVLRTSKLGRITELGFLEVIHGRAHLNRQAVLDAVLADGEADAILVMNCPTALASSTDAAQAVIDSIHRVSVVRDFETDGGLI